MAVKILYHGHSNVEIFSGEGRIQIDPFYSGNTHADVSPDKVSPTHILITHAHSDHVGDGLAIAKRTKAPIICCFEMAQYFEKKGAPETVGMNHGGSLLLPFGKVTMTLAFHTSSFEDGTYGGQPAGFIVETGGKTIYHAGDTALFGDMKLLGELYNIDLAFLPIGDLFTMGPAHAVLAAKFLKAKKVVPIHYGTWPPIAQDGGKFALSLRAEGIEGVAMKAGEMMDV